MLVKHPPSGPCCAVDVTLRQPQQREARNGVVPLSARLAVGAGGRIELAAQAVQLAPLILREAERWMERVRQSLAGPFGLDGGVGP